MNCRRWLFEIAQEVAWNSGGRKKSESKNKIIVYFSFNLFAWARMKNKLSFSSTFHYVYIWFFSLIETSSTFSSQLCLAIEHLKIKKPLFGIITTWFTISKCCCATYALQINHKNMLPSYPLIVFFSST